MSVGIDYFYRIQAHTALNVSDPSPVLRISTEFIAPSNLVGNIISDESLELTWEHDCSYETGYTIERKTGTDDFVEVGSTNANVLSWTDESLTYGLNYSYQVKAYTSLNSSEYDNVEIQLIMPAPENLNCIALNTHNIRLSWEHECDYEGGYRIEKMNDAGIYEQVWVFSADIFNWTDRDVEIGSRNNYRINSYKGKITSAFSDTTGLTINKPSVETHSYVTLGLTDIEISGEVTSDGELYVTERGFCWSLLPEPTIIDDHIISGSGNGNFTGIIDDLFYDSTYYARAYATNGAGISYGDSVVVILGAVIDVDGNVYRTVEIGDQIWMAENLKVTHYKNGDKIAKVSDAPIWSTSSVGTYCNYGFDDSNANTYGSLYNKKAIIDDRGIAPEGWHVPTDEEWKELERFIGISESELGRWTFRGEDEGDDLKSISGWNYNGNGTDEYGFNLFPAGLISYDGQFHVIGQGSRLATSTLYDGYYMIYREFFYNSSQIDRGVLTTNSGISVRCVKDE